MTAPRCTLVVLFNHPFPKNIEKLRAISSQSPSDLQIIYCGFDDTLLYRHPVKLSALAIQPVP